MNKKISIAAFVAGGLVVVWVGFGYLGSHVLALAMTVLIGVVYAMGAQELWRFDRATAGLDAALSALPENLPSLGAWLGQAPPSLQNAVRLRIEGERVSLPGPVVTPYLVGLLVMLGMLGTFLGMVVTLNGAVLALESTTDLQTIRASLATPVKGLGLAFGTSVAGVAASAMLGLMSALCRRERLRVAQGLDARIATVLRGFSLVHQRQETFKALQVQSQALPEVVEKMAAMMDRMAQQQAEHQAHLLAHQDSFYREVKGVYATLAQSVDQSLQRALVDSARTAGETLQPVAEATMAGLARETTAFHGQMAATVAVQLDGLSSRFDHAMQAVTAHWTTAQGSWQDELARRDQQGLDALSQSVAAIAANLQKSWQHATEQTQAQQQQICRTLEDTAQQIVEQSRTQAGKTIAEINQLMQAAAEAPRAAAEVVGQLRHELSNSLARDNVLLEERHQLMDTLQTLLSGINHAAAEQRQVIDALVGDSAKMLDRVSVEFSARVGGERDRLVEVADQVSASAVEVASLGEALQSAVLQFGASNTQMIAGLTRIEQALDQSVARSDDQLAYYVAQARELIDLSVLSQQRILEELRQMAGVTSAGASSARGGMSGLVREAA